MTLARLRRVQWILRAALAFALLISMATNVLHAENDPIAQGVAAWSPLALFVAIEVMMRVPVRSMVRAGLRIVATASIAGIAAWTSYWHMVGVVARYEHGEVPYLLPLSVDGLILVLSVSLFDVASQIREHLDTAPPAAPPAAPAADAPPASLPIDTVPALLPDTPALDATTSEASTPRDAAPADEPANTGPGDDDHETRDDEDQDDEDQDEDQDLRNSDDTGSDGHPDLAADLVPHLPAARAARDELLEEGVTVSRDALAQRLRRNGTALRNTRVSELLAVLKSETGSVNGSRPKASV